MRSVPAEQVECVATAVRRALSALTSVFSDVFCKGTSVTVPGRGGRPRKWSSDADRKRAFRARRRGGVEPSTFDAALDQGEAPARALARQALALGECVVGRWSEAIRRTTSRGRTTGARLDECRSVVAF